VSSARRKLRRAGLWPAAVTGVMGHNFTSQFNVRNPKVDIQQLQEMCGYFVLSTCLLALHAATDIDTVF